VFENISHVWVHGVRVLLYLFVLERISIECSLSNVGENINIVFSRTLERISI